jgi:hypothetical protein
LYRIFTSRHTKKYSNSLYCYTSPNRKSIHPRGGSMRTVAAPAGSGSCATSGGALIDAIRIRVSLQKVFREKSDAQPRAKAG